MQRYMMKYELHPHMVDSYIKLHQAVWPDVLKTITQCNIQNYSIAICGSELFSYFEYIGIDYAADMAKMESDPITQQWWELTHPCFLHHTEGHYGDPLEEIFYHP